MIGNGDYKGSFMAEFRMLKLLGGVGNGLGVPTHWESGERYEFTIPGTDNSGFYEARQYFRDSDVYYVWVETTVPPEGFLAVMFWHFEMERGTLVDAQKDLLHTSMTSSTQYTNVIMVVGYAALFTLWTQTKGMFTTATTLWSGVFLAISILFFVGWEVTQMIMRSMFNIRIGRAVADIDLFRERMRAVNQQQQSFIRRLYPAWTVVIAIAVASALSAFTIMLSALLHGAWIDFLRDSILQASG